jgi:cGMP-dependent protein kinase 1
LDGTCQIIINNEKKRTLTFGDSFGDLGIVYSAPRSASVLTLTDCYFVEMNRKVFRKVMEDINSAYEQ